MPYKFPLEENARPEKQSPALPTSVATPAAGLIVTSRGITPPIPDWHWLAPETLNKAHNFPVVGSLASPVAPTAVNPDRVMGIVAIVAPVSEFTTRRLALGLMLEPVETVKSVRSASEPDGSKMSNAQIQNNRLGKFLLMMLLTK
jgi:hypothetical protein